ncbi:hypothetical protein AUP68_17650 [Ilyonectria robusta]
MIGCRRRDITITGVTVHTGADEEGAEQNTTTVRIKIWEKRPHHILHSYLEKAQPAHLVGGLARYLDYPVLPTTNASTTSAIWGSLDFKGWDHVRDLHRGKSISLRLPHHHSDASTQRRIDTASDHMQAFPRRTNPGRVLAQRHGLGGKPGQQNTVREAGVKERGRHSSTLSLAGDVEGITRPQVTRPTSVFSLAHRITSVLDPSQRDRPQCSSLLHNRMEPLQTAPRVGLDFCAPRVCKPVEIRAHVEYPLMRVHADSSPSGVQWLWPCSTFRENATLDATSTAVGSSKVTHSRRQACSVGRRREAGPVRTTLQQSSMDVNPPATLCCATPTTNFNHPQSAKMICRCVYQVDGMGSLFLLGCHAGHPLRSP